MPDLFNPQSLNRYAYCLNNPVKYIDPSGHYTGPPAGSDPMSNGSSGGNDYNSMGGFYGEVSASNAPGYDGFGGDTDAWAASRSEPRVVVQEEMHETWFGMTVNKTTVTVAQYGKTVTTAAWGSEGKSLAAMANGFIDALSKNPLSGRISISISKGEIITALKVSLGVGSIVYGTLAKKPKIVATGITITADGGASALVELLGGDSGLIPNEHEIALGIAKGMFPGLGF